MPDKPKHIGIMSVCSDVAADGTYTLTVHAGDDLAFVLDRDRAVRYALTVLTAAHYADYEAAVWAQMNTAGLDQDSTLLALAAMREKRRPLDHEATAPLRFEPILSARTGRASSLSTSTANRPGNWKPPQQPSTPATC